MRVPEAYATLRHIDASPLNHSACMHAQAGHQQANEMPPSGVSECSMGLLTPSPTRTANLAHVWKSAFQVFHRTNS